MAPIPTTILDHGTVVYELTSAPELGDLIVVYSRGRFRLAAVSKVTPTRIQCEYRTPSGGATITRPWVKRGDVIDAPSPSPLEIALGTGDPVPDPVYARAWTIVGRARNLSHLLAPIDAPAERVGYAGAGDM